MKKRINKEVGGKKGVNIRGEENKAGCNKDVPNGVTNNAKNLFYSESGLVEFTPQKQFTLVFFYYYYFFSFYLSEFLKS